MMKSTKPGTLIGIQFHGNQVLANNAFLEDLFSNQLTMEDAIDIQVDEATLAAGPAHEYI